ncbi:MAG: hypothetical protein BWY22_01048 [Bacteroidetes bacterium ADurb.Bin217]|nr:MAG: hypothetical protein BWY22_01048 [Bacteroidetes bacterium ADurb.Bin217]
MSLPNFANEPALFSLATSYGYLSQLSTTYISGRIPNRWYNCIPNILFS